MTKHEVIRILKRYVAREVYRYLPPAKSSGCRSGSPPNCRPPGLASSDSPTLSPGPPTLKTRDLIRACPHLE